MKSGKALSLFLITIVLTACFGFFNLTPTASADDMGLITKSQYPVVYVYPQNVTTPIGENFTIAVIGFNFTNEIINEPGGSATRQLGNLMGFDIKFTWDRAILKYIKHTVTTPSPDYPAPNLPSPYLGVLNGSNPLQVMDYVNESGHMPDTDPEVRAWFAYATMYPALPQNGNCTFFTMTFQVIKTGESPLRIVGCDLASDDPQIYSLVRNGAYRTAGVPVTDFTYQPKLPVLDRPVNFTATVSENTSSIRSDGYLWDFGDGNKENVSAPTVLHTYASQGNYTVNLKVVDMFGIESATVSRFANVIVRDLRVEKVELPPAARVRVGPMNIINMSATIRNFGPVVENFTTHAYFNTSNVDLVNPFTASWAFIDSVNSSVNAWQPGAIGAKTVYTGINSTILPPMAHYHFLVNVTGIPAEFERNMTDNYMVSPTAIFATNVTIHDVLINSYDCLLIVGTGTTAKRWSPPFAEGEKTTIRLAIRNNGTDEENASIKLYSNGTVLTQFNVTLGFSELRAVADWTETLGLGNHNMTIVVQAGDSIVSATKWVRIIRTPLIQVSITPSEIVANQTLVTFSANGTIHQDTGGNVTSWTWGVYRPGSAWDTSDPLVTLNGKTVTYNFTREGNWTVVLRIIDNYDIAYDDQRPASSAYLQVEMVNVKATGGGETENGLPLMYILAIVLVVVAIVAAVLVIFIRRRRVGPTEVKKDSIET